MFELAPKRIYRRLGGIGPHTGRQHPQPLRRLGIIAWHDTETASLAPGSMLAGTGMFLAVSQLDGNPARARLRRCQREYSRQCGPCPAL